MRLTWAVYGLELTTPLRISRSTMSRRDAVRVSVEHEGLVGNGEVVTSVYYGLDVATITALLKEVPLADTPESALAALPSLALPAGVRAAIDAALHDLIGLRRDVPVHYLLPRPPATAPANPSTAPANHPQLSPPPTPPPTPPIDWSGAVPPERVGAVPERAAGIYRPLWTDWAAGAAVPTAYTIGICAPRDAARQALALVGRGFQVLKVKVGNDVGAVAAIRAVAPDVRLLLDPNGAWTAEQAIRVLDDLAPLNVDAVEQPIAPGDVDALGWLSARSPIPVIADEDAATVADVRALAGAAHGVNIKLAKCGGISAALEIADAARAGGLDVMLGCLVASSLGIAPAVHLVGHARWVDLDGHLLLADDPWSGIGGETGALRVPTAPGLGVHPR